MRKLNDSGIAALAVIGLVLLLGVIGFIGYHVNSKYRENSKQDGSSQAATTSKKSQSTNEATVVEYGSIEGEASYPSEGLPEDEEVCAVNVNDQSKIFCDKEVGARFAAQDKCVIGDMNCNKPAPDLSYSIKVPVGEYYVYSTTESRNPGYKAYYNEFSKCGNSVDCPASSHKKYIKVVVEANRTVSNIDPSDWYAQ
jgi:hypothetical protein